jgi:hypothetical protein
MCFISNFLFTPLEHEERERLPPGRVLFLFFFLPVLSFMSLSKFPNTNPFQLAVGAKTNFLSPLFDTQRVANPNRKRKHGPGADPETLAGNTSAQVKNRGRQSVITPQSFVAYNINPSSDKSRRVPGNDKRCLAPYTDSDAAYAVLEGEVALCWSDDIERSSKASELGPTGMPRVRVFTTVGGILISDMHKIRVVGMAKVGGAGRGLDLSMDNQAGVVIGHGLCTMQHVGTGDMLVGHYAYVNLFPALSSTDSAGRPVRAVDTPFVDPGKWYPATQCLSSIDIVGLVQHMHNECEKHVLLEKTHLMAKASRGLLNFRQIVEAVENWIKGSFGDLRPDMPMWNYALLCAAQYILDGWGKYHSDTTKVLSQSIVLFLIWAIQQCDRTAATILQRYERALGHKEVSPPTMYRKEQFQKDTYASFNVKVRALLTKYMSVEQNESERWIQSFVLGRIVTGCKPGYSFDVMIGMK